MILNYRIKHNGIDYPIGTDVPLEDIVQGETSTKKEIKEPIKVVEEVIEPVIAEVKEKEYTKTEINRMSTADLKALAKERGLDDTLSGSELKKVLIEKLV